MGARGLLADAVQLIRLAALQETVEFSQPPFDPLRELAVDRHAACGQPQHELRVVEMAHQPAAQVKHDIVPPA